MRRALIKGLLGTALLLGGCQQALFPKGEPRTQFDKHDRMQGAYIPLQEPDVFGKPQPALRARLTRE